MASAPAKTARSGDKIVPKKQSLFDDSASSSEDDQEDGGATLGGQAPGLKINEEYARRFEHNKKREELQRLQEKYGAGEESESSSEDESEDDEAALITEDLDAEISATLAAIKNKDPRIYDKEAVFYRPFDPTKDVEQDDEKKEKPMFLRDYHRERYMAGDVGADDDDTTAANPNVPRTYVQEQADLKNAILSEINAAADDEEWSDDDAFIKPAKKPEPAAPAANGVHPSRVAHVEVTELDVKNADKNPEEFLSKFMASKAWAPDHKWQAFDSDEEDGEDDIADEFEHAYNMRFEDPTKSNEVLKTYSRNMANARSARKEELTGRKKLRALEKEKKEAEKKQREAERARLRRLKIEEASEKLKKIKQAAGMNGKQLTDEEWVKFLDDAWEDDQWEEEMKKRFDDDYYNEADDMLVDSEEEEGSGSEEEDGKKRKKSKKPKKPKWDDDIDIKDIIPDFKDDEEEAPAISLSDLEADQPAPSVEGSDSESDDSDRPAKKRKTTKDLKKEKAAAKRQAKAELAKIEALVDTKMEIEQPRALSFKKGKETFTFKYRETSPTSFGLTARDILLAPSDAALNEFAGLKKLASFRDAEKKRKDKKKLGKKARLRQWRRETFGREYEETGPTFGFEALLEDGSKEKKKSKGSGANSVRVGGRGEKEEEKEEEKVQEKVVVDGIVEGERKKKRKRSKKGKGEGGKGEGGKGEGVRGG
ncbi:KRI1-like family C-terminal-domain-containing protein [Apiosordaria backusii]|uniref:KRI1-like family C-terminal-domain-containing protein n=1 Tax=Apiosordaria backusii TaxID=314023 RepID=A0AA40F0K8_9PEZI|nr:KRI1-like family C-terminal-domain-containing protein [Apiosordaria backusii]